MTNDNKLKSGTENANPQSSRVRSYRDLLAWRKGMELANAVYRLTSGFPSDERYGLTAQLRRAAVSVPANVAEGYRRRHRADYLRFLGIALGSQAEVETLLLLALDLGLAEGRQVEPVLGLADAAGAILFRLVESLSGGQSYLVKEEDGSPLPDACFQDNA